MTSVQDLFVWLGAVNAGFWILARGMGAFVDVFSELFWEPLWELLATIYNLVLAILFAAVLFATAAHGAPPADVYWREACGFVLLYVALSAAFVDPSTHELDDAGRPGFLAALAFYVLFAAVPALAAHPILDDLIAAAKATADSPIGMAAALFAAAGLAFRLARYGLRELFGVLGPVLYRAGVLKLPPIRVRRRAD